MIGKRIEMKTILTTILTLFLLGCHKGPKTGYVVKAPSGSTHVFETQLEAIKYIELANKNGSEVLGGKSPGVWSVYKAGDKPQ